MKKDKPIFYREDTPNLKVSLIYAIIFVIGVYLFGPF